MSAFQLVWLRNDLRHYDNAALAAAAQTGLPVVAVFIATPKTWQQHDMAPPSCVSRVVLIGIRSLQRVGKSG